MAASKMAKVTMRKISIYGYHGNTPEEKEIGRWFEVDCEFMVDISKATKSDSLDDTIDYAEVYKVIEETISNNKFNLIETLSDRIAQAILDRFNIGNIKLKVRKMTPPIPGNIEFVEIETERAR